ncbi:MAG: (d)CMP kinase [Acidimicrobiales bacterium]
MLVTLSGLPGSGTSTVARRVADDLEIAHLDGGSVFRALAAERKVSLAAFALLAESDAAIDRALDDRLTERAVAGDVLIESRLAGWLAAAVGLVGVRVWLGCDDTERARRVAARDHLTVEEALGANAAREGSERARYLAYYDIDLTDQRPYHLVLDSTTRSPDELAAEIVSRARWEAAEASM